MSIKTIYKGVKKLNHGPGGIGCPCCNTFGCCPQKMKPRSRRLARRVKKQELNKELGYLSRED